MVKDLTELSAERGSSRVVEAVKRNLKRLSAEHSGSRVNAIPRENSSPATCALQTTKVIPRPRQASGSLPPIVKGHHFLAEKLPKREVLIEGLLQQGSKMLLGSGAKVGKTWCLLDLALSVCVGADWWGFKTQQTPVLYLNFEIDEPNFQWRIGEVAKARGIAKEALDALSVWNLRGCGRDFVKLRDAVVVGAENHGLIILDPLYKVLGDRDENSAGQMGELLNEFESVTEDTGAAFVYCHHFSKGNQSKKASIDRMSGSGVFGRDADTLLVMTPHQNEDTYTVEATLRYFRPLDAFCVKKEYPLMKRDSSADPLQLKQLRKPQKQYTCDRILEVMSLDSWKHNALKEEVINTTGMSGSTFAERFRELRNTGRIVQDDASKEWTVLNADASCSAEV